MEQNAGMVFIHGAGLGAFIWDDLKATLNVPSLFTDFPNRNKGNKANVKLDFDDYVRKIISGIYHFKKEKMIIVAHSIGGVVGLKVADHFRSRIVGFVAIGAAIPESGKSFISCLPFPQKIIMPLILKVAGTKPPESEIVKTLCNDLNADQTRKITENFTPEPVSLYTRKVKYRLPEAERMYVQLNNDTGFPPAMQEKMAKNLEAGETVSLETGHLPMMSKPVKLGKLLNEFSQKCMLKG
jgi:pimeloyl-ACP methyl ester carboxylesterase